MKRSTVRRPSRGVLRGRAFFKQRTRGGMDPLLITVWPGLRSALGLRSGYAPVFFRHHLISIACRSGRKETAAAPLPSPLDRDSRQFPPLWLPLLLPLLLLLCFCFASFRFPSLVRRICCLQFSPPHSCFLQRISLSPLPKILQWPPRSPIIAGFRHRTGASTCFRLPTPAFAAPGMMTTR
jgi:hypothetical protein